jgi:outer membrane lipoprotein-sorting protein
VLAGLAIVQLLLVTPAAAQPRPDEIIARMDAAMRGDSSYAEMVMRIERPRYSREVALRAWAKGRDASLILITAPARDKGTVYLLRDQDIWTYDPRIDRTTRLPSSMMAQSWMGSDFTNDDLIRDTDPVRDYHHRLVTITDYRGDRSYLVEMIPKPETPIVWGKVLIWVRVADYLQLRLEYYDQRDVLVSTMEMDQMTRFDDRVIPARITVTPADTEGERTVLNYRQVNFNIPIDDGFFSRATMQRLR